MVLTRRIKTMMDGSSFLVAICWTTFILKVDIEKAYDNISLEYIDLVLSQMGFPGLWRTWVRSICVTPKFLKDF
uniref:Reverse transcriptase domain-containing protein n=1 Tax=Helianthus annuus TaxID=4232 RepID=A0A251RNV2_HELAN